MFLMNYVQMKLGILFCIWLRITPQHIIFIFHIQFKAKMIHFKKDMFELTM